MKENIRPPEEYVDQRGHSFCCQNDDIYAVAPLADSDIATDDPSLEIEWLCL